MRVLVTGATGFLGGQVVEKLIGGGHDVRALVRNPSAWSARPDGIDVVQGDVTDAAAIDRAIEGAEAVIHAAALVKLWVRDRRDFDRVNVEAVGRMAKAAKREGIRLVHTSSFMALGPTDGEIFDEETPRASEHFNNDYERTKWLGDQLTRQLSSQGQDIVRVYPGVVFGPGALTAGNHVVHLLLQHAQGKLPGMLGQGSQRQCFAYVDDVAAGVVAALEQGRSGAGYVLGGENRTAIDLFAAFEQASGVAPPKRKIPFGVAALIGKVQRWRAQLFGVEPELTDEVVGVYRHEWAYSSARAESELGYRITPFDEAVRCTVDWLRRTGAWPRGD